MDVFLKASAGVLVTVVLILTLSKQWKDVSLLLMIAACCMVGVSAMRYLRPVMDFLERLQGIGNLDTEIFSVLLKSVGIGLIAEFTSLVCADAGNSSLGKATQLMATAAIVWISIPLLDKLMELIDNILGAI